MIQGSSQTRILFSIFLVILLQRSGTISVKALLADQSRTGSARFEHSVVPPVATRKNLSSSSGFLMHLRSYYLQKKKKRRTGTLPFITWRMDPRAASPRQPAQLTHQQTPPDEALDRVWAEFSGPDFRTGFPAVPVFALAGTERLWSIAQ